MAIKPTRNDVVSGFVIFLIALPLSLGISLASGAPASAGLLAAILGGIVGVFVGGTHVAINGPAAGLIVVVLHAVQSLSDGDPLTGFKRTLACIFVAGVMQIFAGLLRAGNLAALCPSPVVHGMLFAIGVIIMIKQYPILLGAVPHSKSIVGLIEEFPQNVEGAAFPIALLGISCLLLLVFWNRLPKNISKWMPGPLLTIAVGVGLGAFLSLKTEYLVDPPMDFASMFVFPDFSRLFSPAGIAATLSIFVVASLESTLSSCAVDKLDPMRRKSDLNRDLIGKGIINACCGLIGALPIISEIVRSSANIAAGAKTKWSNFFHGVFILLFVALFPTLLHQIPLAALAAVLMVTGYRLAHPLELKKVASHGWDQLLIFLTVTTISTVKDLLVGIGCGLVLSVILHLIKGVRLRDFVAPQFMVLQKGDTVTITAKSPAVFSNFLRYKKLLDNLPSQCAVVLDFRETQIMDFTFSTNLQDYLREFHGEVKVLLPAQGLPHYAEELL